MRADRLFTELADLPSPAYRGGPGPTPVRTSINAVLDPVRPYLCDITIKPLFRYYLGETPLLCVFRPGSGRVGGESQISRYRRKAKVAEIGSESANDPIFIGQMRFRYERPFSPSWEEGENGLRPRPGAVRA